MMVSYLEMNCKGMAHVVKNSESDAEIVDIDLARSKSLLKERLAQQPSKPIIVLSSKKVLADNIIYVQKPIDAHHVIDALKTAKKSLLSNKVAPPKTTRSNKVARKSAKRSRNRRKSKRVKTVNPMTIANPKQENVQETLWISDSNMLDSHSTASFPESTTLLKGDEQHKEYSSKPVESTTLASTKNASENKKTSPFSISILEIDSLLKELHSVLNKPLFAEKKIEVSEKNDRKSVRYAFPPIEASIKKKSFNGNKFFTAQVLNLSSRGALIELDKPSKLRGKIMVEIQFDDAQHVFEIPAKIVRKEGNSIYGLQFLKYQHDLLEHLINTGHSFIFS